MDLWIDDLRDPSDFGKPDWHWAKTITEAIRILATRKVEHVSIDHDICHVLPMKSKSIHEATSSPVMLQPITCPENYTAVAYYIAAMTIDERPREVVVHTANPIGAKEIVRILEDAVLNVVVSMA